MNLYRQNITIGKLTVYMPENGVEPGMNEAGGHFDDRSVFIRSGQTMEAVNWVRCDIFRTASLNNSRFSLSLLAGQNVRGVLMT